MSPFCSTQGNSVFSLHGHNCDLFSLYSICRFTEVRGRVRLRSVRVIGGPQKNRDTRSRTDKSSGRGVV